MFHILANINIYDWIYLKRVTSNPDFATLFVEIAGGERSGVEGLPEHIVVEVHHLVKPRLVAPAPHVNQIMHALFGRVVLLLGPHIDLRHT